MFVYLFLFFRFIYILISSNNQPTFFLVYDVVKRLGADMLVKQKVLKLNLRDLLRSQVEVQNKFGLLCLEKDEGVSAFCKMNAPIGQFHRC